MLTSRDRHTDKLMRSFMSIDQYGEPIQFALNGHTRFPSVCGVILTLIASSILLGYGINKTIALVNYTDSNYMRKIEEEAIDPSEKFGWDQTKLNAVIFLEKNGARLNIDSIREYITVKA